MNHEVHEVYEFGDYRLDAVRRTLSRLSGESVPIRARSFDVLRYLVEHSGELVERNTLLANIWPDVVVEDQNLHKYISVLRRVLGNGPESQEYIATIPGRGYQLVREVFARPSTDTQRISSPGGERQRSRGPDARSPVRALLTVNPAERLLGSAASGRPSRTCVRLSPDGRTIVFIGVRGAVQQLFKRRLQDWEATAMPGTEGAQALFFSPQGKWVGFWAAGHFKKAPLDGGPPVEIGEIARAERMVLWGATWGSTDDILFSTPQLNGIWRISATGGGTPEQIVQPGDRWYFAPHLLPNGRGVLFTVAEAAIGGRADLVVHDFASGEQRTLQRDAADGRYLPSGHLLFMRRGTLMAARFDAERLVVTGEPVAVLRDVMQAIRHRNNGDETWAGQYDVANGTLVFLTGGIHPPGRSEFVLSDRQGAVTPLNLGPGFYRAPRMSPNRKHIAYFAEDDDGARDIWVYDVESQTTRRLTFDGGVWPIWSPDGRTLLYSRRGHLRTIAANGNGLPAEIPRNATTEELWMVPCSWVGANAIAVSSNNSGIWSLAMDGTDIATPFLQRDHTLAYPAASPDERWIAYSSWETGAADVWVQRNEPNGERVRVSRKGLNNASGGSSPKWTQGGSELIFVQRSEHDTVQLVAIRVVERADSFRFDTPRILFEGPFVQMFPAHGYDVSADGQQFVMVKNSTPPAPPVTQIQLVLNWQQELDELVPTD